MRAGTSEIGGPGGRRNLLARKLPRYPVEILDEELEARGCRRIGFEDSAQLIFDVADSWCWSSGWPSTRSSKTVARRWWTVPSHETLFPRVFLHSSTVARIIVSKFGLGVPHYRLEQDLADQSWRSTAGR